MLPLLEQDKPKSLDPSDLGESKEIENKYEPYSTFSR